MSIIKTYYEDLGLGHDAILRCSDCKRLVTHDNLIKAKGCPKCNNKRVVEITTLTLWEWFLIKTGILSFPYRKEFLAEFSHKGGDSDVR